MKIGILHLVRVDDAMQHKRIQREERAAHYYIAISLLIAISNPLLPPASHAIEVIIVSAAHYGVRIAQPERRRQSAGRHVDEYAGVLQAQFFDKMNRRRKVAVKDAAGKHLAGVARAVDLELVYAIL